MKKEKNLKYSLLEIEKALEAEKEKLKAFEKKKLFFQFSDSFETIGRCYELLGEKDLARQQFNNAIGAIGSEIKERNTGKQDNRPTTDDLWLYYFQSFWLCYKAGDTTKMKSLAEALDQLVPNLAKPIGLAERIEVTLSFFICGDNQKAGKLYKKFELRQYEKTDYHPEVKIIAAGLFKNPSLAKRAVEILEREISLSGIKPWYANNYEFDLRQIAKTLL